MLDDTHSNDVMDTDASHCVPKVVKSFGISIDSSRINEVSLQDRPDDLSGLEVNIFDQDVFEEAVLQQVDEAISKREEALKKERLIKDLKEIDDELSNIDGKIACAKQHVKELMIAKVDELTRRKNEIQQRLLAQSKEHVDDEDVPTTSREIDCEHHVHSILHLDGHLETETEKLVRLGEMTPFGSLGNNTAVAVNTKSADDDIIRNVTSLTRHKGSMISSRTSNNSSVEHVKDSCSFKTTSYYEKANNDVGDMNLSNGADSDCDYVPTNEELISSFNDDEDMLFDEDECLDNGYIDEKKRRRNEKEKVEKSTKKMMQPTRDDGDDKIYERRIREFKLKKSLRKKGIFYEGQTDEEDDFENEKIVDEEFDGGFKMPAVIWKKLFRYQKTGVKWLWELHTQQAGGIVGDEMGLGKTIQVIAFLAGLKYSKIGRQSSKQNCLGPVLIICPATVLFQWVREFHKWWPEFRVAVLHNTGSHNGSKETLVTKVRNEPGVLLTTYSGVRLNQDSLLQSRWDYVILDEGHIIRNPDAEVTLICKQFRTPHRLVLSGSPMQNNLRELWSLFDFVYPGKLGTLPVFMQEFSVPITMGGYSNASSVQVQTAYKCACVLRDTINPYLLRRMKKDVKMKLDLPNKNEQVLFCRLTEEQIDLYKEYLSSRDVSSILSGNMKVFPGLIMLRKICNHPDLTSEAGSIWKLRKDCEAKQTNVSNNTEGNDDGCGDCKRSGTKHTSVSDNSEGIDLGYGDWKRSGKLIVVQSLLKLWKKQSHKVLLFTQTRQMLKIFEIFVKSEGYNYCKMDGSTSISSRQPLVEKFNKDDSIFVFLLTTRVGGLGVNLVGANRVIIYDPDWNPGTDMQARERAWRVGQKKDVTIYRLLTTGTIEEKIYHRQIFKQFLTNRVLKDPKQRRFFKSNDLFELFTLDTSDNKKTGTETAAIFAGLGCEVPVPRKSKFNKWKHKSTRERKTSKSIRERTQEILRTQFPNRIMQKQNEKCDDELNEKDVSSEKGKSVLDPESSLKEEELKKQIANSRNVFEESTMKLSDNSRNCSTSEEDRVFSPSARLHTDPNIGCSTLEGDRVSSPSARLHTDPNLGCSTLEGDRVSSPNARLRTDPNLGCSTLEGDGVSSPNARLHTDPNLGCSTLEEDRVSSPSARLHTDPNLGCSTLEGNRASSPIALPNISQNSCSTDKDCAEKLRMSNDFVVKDLKIDKNETRKGKGGKSLEKRRKRKKRKRNEIEGVRIGQLSHSELYKDKKSLENVDNNSEDDYILRKLFKKSGVHSALQHDTIVNSGRADHILIENEAKRVAAEATEALKRSREQCQQLRNSGLPTWTGRSGIVGSPLVPRGRRLFGPTSNVETKCENGSSVPFSGKSFEHNNGMESSNSGLGLPMSSTQLLARMRARNSIGGSNAAGDMQSGEQKYFETMMELRNFIASGCSCPGRATTQEILAEFSSRLSAEDSAIFRQLLRSICNFNRSASGEGLWMLKSEFS